MKKLLAFPLMLLLAASVCGCQSEKQKQQEKELEELRELAKMDRQEMENQYEQFALQYDELKKASETTRSSYGWKKNANVHRNSLRNCDGLKITMLQKYDA